VQLHKDSKTITFLKCAGHDSHTMAGLQGHAARQWALLLP
jgi:hypothetical protein